MRIWQEICCATRWLRCGSLRFGVTYLGTFASRLRPRLASGPLATISCQILRRAHAVRWVVRASTVLGAVLALGCAAIASEVAGELLGVCLEITARAACASLCDDDADDPPPEELDAQPAAPAEPPPPDWRPTVADCEVKRDASGVFVDCAGGTRAVFLAGTELGGADADAARLPTRYGPLELRDPGDVGRLAGTRAIDGDLAINAPALVSLTAPELQSIGGNLIVTRAPALERLALPALAAVGGTVVISDNPRLPQREAEQIVFRLTRHGFAGAVEVAGNALP